MTQLVFTSKGSAEVLRQQQLMNEGAKKMGDLYKDDARAASELERAILRVFKSPQQSAKAFNDALATIKKNFSDGKLSAAEYEKQVHRLNDAYATTKDSLSEFKPLNEQSFGSMAVAKVGGFIGAIGGITAAIGLAKSEYEALIALQDKATSTKLDVGQARNLIIRNMLGSSPKEITGVLGQATALAGELRLPESVIAQALADAMSASGGTAKDAFAAVRLAGKYLPDQQGEIGQFAGSLIDLQKVTGSADQRVNFGLLSSIGQRSRVASPGAIAANAPKALIGAAGLAGATGAEGAAFYSALTSAAADITGATSGSATIEFARSLGITFPKQLRKAGDDGLAAQFERLSMGGKIAMLQNDPALAQRFLTMEGLSLGSGDAVAPLRSLLLNPNGGMATAYRNNLAATPSNAGLIRIADEAIGNFRLNPLNTLANGSRTIRNLHEQVMLSMPDTLGAEDRAMLSEIMRGDGKTNLGTRLNMMTGQFADGKVGTSISDARDLFVGERNRLNAGYTAPTFGPGGGGTFQDPNARQSVDRLDKVIAALDKLLEENKRTTKAVKDSAGIPVGNN